MADAKAAREQLIAELDRRAKSADAKDASDRVRALRDLEGVQDEFDDLYSNIDLRNAAPATIDALGVQLRRAGVALRGMQAVEGSRDHGDEADAKVAEEEETPVSSVAVAATLDHQIEKGNVDPVTHFGTGADATVTADSEG